MTQQEVISLDMDELWVSPMEFEEARRRIIAGNQPDAVRFPEDEEADSGLVALYVKKAYRDTFGGSANYDKESEDEENSGLNAGEAYFSQNVVSALKGEASWNGIVMDLLGVTGFEQSHRMVADNLHSGTLDDVATERSVVAFLVQIGAPINTITSILESQGSALLEED